MSVATRSTGTGNRPCLAHREEPCGDEKAHSVGQSIPSNAKVPGDVDGPRIEVIDPVVPLRQWKRSHAVLYPEFSESVLFGRGNRISAGLSASFSCAPDSQDDEINEQNTSEWQSESIDVEFQ